ncbi:MAG TPA: cytochrome C oxidase subunit IV family protein [Pirellulales bacterium]
MSEEHTTAPAVDSGAHDEHHPHVNYWYIFYALCVLTGLSVLADVARESSTFTSLTGTHNAAFVVCFIVLSVATAKALFVMLYFMHLKFEGKWKFVLLAPTIVLAMAIPAALMPDIGSHYYDYEVPQLEPEEDPALAAEGPGGHGTGGHGTGGHTAGSPAEHGPSSNGPASHETGSPSH